MTFSNFNFKVFEFWDSFCPKYNWVAPESGATTGNGYLKTTWDRATSIHAINFRLFLKFFVIILNYQFKNCFFCNVIKFATLFISKIKNGNSLSWTQILLLVLIRSPIIALSKFVQKPQKLLAQQQI